MYLEQLAESFAAAQSRGANIGDTQNQVLEQKNNIQINFDLVKESLNNKYIDLELIKNRMVNIDFSNLLSDISINTNDNNEVRYIEMYAALVSNKNALEGIKSQLEHWNNNNFDSINILDTNPILQLINDIVVGLSELEQTLEQAVSRLHNISIEIGENGDTTSNIDNSSDQMESIDLSDSIVETGSNLESGSSVETISNGLRKFYMLENLKSAGSVDLL